MIMLKLPFNSTNRDIGAIAFEKDCVTPLSSDNYFVASITTPTSSQPDGYIQFNTMLEMNVTAINGTKYWNQYTDGTRGGWVQMCVETFLSFEDDIDLGNNDSNPKVNFKNNVLNISVSLTANYEIDDVDVERADAIEERVETDYSDFITAYECAETDLYNKATATYNQGDEIIICVKDESTNIVQVEEFFNLVVAQEGNSDYNFVKNRMWNPDITTVACVDGTTVSDRRVCYAKIRALAQFFSSGNPPDLTLSGSVYVRRDGRRVRQILRNVLPTSEKKNEEDALYASSHRLQEATGSGDFEVKVGLASGNDSAASDYNIGSTGAGLISSIIGAAGLALML